MADSGGSNDLARDVKEILLELEHLLIFKHTILFLRPKPAMPQSFANFFSEKESVKTIGRLLIINNLCLTSESRDDFSK